MEQGIRFSKIESSVLVDVLEWYRTIDDVEEFIHDTSIISHSFNPNVSPEVIEQLRDEHVLSTTAIPPQELEPLLNAFAAVLQDQAWDLENTQATFEFYENTFASIEEKVKQQTHER